MMSARQAAPFGPTVDGPQAAPAIGRLDPAGRAVPVTRNVNAAIRLRASPPNVSL